MLGAVAEFERSMILERQREGIALAKAAGKYKGRKASLSDDQADELRARLQAREPVAALAREYGISRQSVYCAPGRNRTCDLGIRRTYRCLLMCLRIVPIGSVSDRSRL